MLEIKTITVRLQSLQSHVDDDVRAYVSKLASYWWWVAGHIVSIEGSYCCKSMCQIISNSSVRARYNSKPTYTI